LCKYNFLFISSSLHQPTYNFIVLYNHKISHMKKFIFLLIAIIPLAALAQKPEYVVSSYLTEGVKAPNTHYIGEAWLNNLLPPDSTLNYNITKATFTANSTLDWHKHASPQILIIVDGEAYYQERGKEPVILKKGDVIKCDKDTEHWHSSTKHTSVTYLAIYSNLPTTWTEKLTQEYYDSVALKLSGRKN
jgi:quercetin dioxygenase-like cupin family protein